MTGWSMTFCISVVIRCWECWGTLRGASNKCILGGNQDHAHDFEDDVSLFDWMGQWTQGEQMVADVDKAAHRSRDVILDPLPPAERKQFMLLLDKLVEAWLVSVSPEWLTRLTTSI